MPFEKIVSSKFCQGDICTFHKVEIDSSVQFFIKKFQVELLWGFLSSFMLWGDNLFFKIEVFNLAFCTVFSDFLPIVLDIYITINKRNYKAYMFAFVNAFSPHSLLAVWKSFMLEIEKRQLGKL